jgi:hypothetical protein
MLSTHLMHPDASIAILSPVGTPGVAHVPELDTVLHTPAHHLKHNTKINNRSINC